MSLRARKILIVVVLILLLFVGAIGYAYIKSSLFALNIDTLNLLAASSTGSPSSTDAISASISTQGGIYDRFGILELNATAVGGRTWFSNWANSKSITLPSGNRDPYDSQFIIRGDGSVSIDGAGIATMSGSAPRMYVYDPAETKKWNNVEVTVYAMRVSENGFADSQGFVIGARSEHQGASLSTPCFGQTYYARMLYDGRTVFQKEIVHEQSYSDNKPSEDQKVDWGTPDNTIPRNQWIGMKYIVHTNTDGKSVNLKLYRDLTGGVNGGTWELVAEYTDAGNWTQNEEGIDSQQLCGFPANEVLLKPATSVFIRNDDVGVAKYKDFSIREIQ